MSTPLGQQRLRELDAQIAERRANYERVKNEMQSAQYSADLAATIGAICTLLSTYKGGDSGEKAIFLLGRLQGVVAPLAEDLLVLDEYETLRRRRKSFEAGLEA